MKIIFLDIDGVLALTRQERDDYGALFHEEFVRNLGRIIHRTGAKIVVSSTWRHSGLEIMKEMWVKRNLPGEVIDITPHGLYTKINGLFTLDNEPTYDKIGVDRGSEIEYWLKSKKFQRINYSKEKQEEYLNASEVKNYIILDDDSDMLYSQCEHFLKCSNQKDTDAIEGYGLTNNLTDRAIKILNTPLIDIYYPEVYENHSN